MYDCFIRSTFIEIYEGEILIVMSRNMSLVFLNPVAACFLELCDDSKKISEIIDEMLEIYEVDKAELTNDIIGLVRTLQRKRIIRTRIKDEEKYGSLF